MTHYELITNINQIDSPNAKNEQGKKLCPITLDILNINNCVKIDNVFYTANGFAKWVRKELLNSRLFYNMVYNNDNMILGLLQQMDSNSFVEYFDIRSPMTNSPYGINDKKVIYDLFIRRGRSQYNDVYAFARNQH